MTAAGKTYVAFAGDGAWHREKAIVGGYRIAKINSESVDLAPLRGGKTLTVYLRDSHTQGAASNGPELFSPAWINSRANPMLYQPRPLLLDLSQHWSSLTQQEKDAICAFYRNYGWELVASESRYGATDFNWSNLYKAARIAAVEANQKAFAASLSPEQQALWDKAREGGTMIKVGPEGVTPELRKKVDEKHAQWVAFTTTFNAEQAAAYRIRDDFTQAKWSPKK